MAPFPTTLLVLILAFSCLCFHVAASAKAQVRKSGEFRFSQAARPSSGSAAKAGAQARDDSALARKLAMACLDMSPSRWNSVCFGGTFVAATFMLMVAVLAGRPFGAALVACMATGVAFILACRLFLRMRVRKGLQLMERQLAQAELQLAENSRSGLSLGRSVLACAEQVADPLRGQLLRLHNEVAYAEVSLADAFEHLASRTESEDARLLASVVCVQQQTGSSLADALCFLNETISRRIEMRQELAGSLAETKITRNIVALVPWALFLLLSFGVGGLLKMDGFWEFYSANPLGWAILFACACIELVILVLMSRMIDIKLD